MLTLYLSLLNSEDDKKRFERLYIDYKDSMYYVANKILRNSQQAEDAVHQAFLRIIENFNRFEEISCPQTRSFCVIVCRNISIDMLKQNIKKDYIPLDDVLGGISDDRRTEDEVIMNLNLELIIDKISQLPTIYKDVILLYYSNDCTIKEIAKALKISNDVAKKRMQRARKQLIYMLQSEDFNNDK